MSKSELEESGRIIMGIGDGGGNLFVEGDYDSIKSLQSKLLELEKVRSENAELRKLLNITKRNTDDI